MRILKAVLAAALLGLPAAAALAQDSYRIRAGDVVRIEVLEDETVNRDILVLPDGRITVPLAGTVRVAGRTLEEVQIDLATRLAPNFAAPPTVFVTLSQLGEREEEEPRLIEVYIMGEATTPGRYEVRPGTTLLQLIAQAGGFSRFAATGRVELRRIDEGGTQRVYSFDYGAPERGGGVSGATRLIPGDVVVIPQRRLFE